METVSNATSSRALHPVFWVAGISVTLLSLAGIAALTGLLPAKPAPAMERPAIVAAAPTTEPQVAVAATAAPVAIPQVPAASVSKTPPASQHKTAKKQVEQDIPASLPLPPAASGVPPDYMPPPVALSAPPAPPLCLDCGVIGNVREVTREGQGSGAGAIIGGIAGGALASNIGRGDGRTLATILGAAGGGMLGNSIEKSQRKTVGYQVTVRMEEGTTRLIDSETLPPWRIGDKVKLVGGAIVAR